MAKKQEYGKNLEMIFATNPELLNAPEVQEMARYATERYKMLHARFRRVSNMIDEVADLIAYSDAVLIKGKPSKEVLLQIWDKWGKL
jgi:hypothetical protein